MKFAWQQNLLPVLAVVGSIISLTVGTSYGKQLFPIVGPGGTAAYRVVLSAIILLIVWRPWRSSLGRKDILAVTLYGVTLGLMNFVFYESIARIPLGIAIAIEFTGPLAVAVLSSHRLIDFVWVALAALGICLLLPLTGSADVPSASNAFAAMSPGNAPLDTMGIVYAFASALCWGLYIIFGKRLAHIPGGVATSTGIGVAALTIFPLGLAETGARLFQPHLLLPALGLALASSAVPYTLEMFALKKLPKNTFSILLSLEPAVGAITGFIVLHEWLSLTQWLAIACVMCASIGTTLASGKESQKPSIDTLPADVL